MKSNKKLLFALAAAVGAVGAVAYLFTTDEGKKVRQKLQGKADEMTVKLEEILNDAKQKFSSWKEEMTAECGRKEQESS